MLTKKKIDVGLINLTILVSLVASSSLFGSKKIDANDLVGENEVIFDPGARHTALFEDSGISYVDGEKGELYYREVPFQKLLCFSYPEAASLLSELDLNETCRPLPQSVVDSFEHIAIKNPMQAMHFVWSLISHEEEDHGPEAAFSYMPTIFAYLIRKKQGLSYIAPLEESSYIENFFYMCTGIHSNQKTELRLIEENLLNLLLITHAEHSVNLSTSTARIISSGYGAEDKDFFNCISAALNALSTPRHGGANTCVIEMFDEIGEVDEVEGYLQKVINKDKVLWGFGHRIYKTQDPRAVLFEQEIEKLVPNFIKEGSLLAQRLAIAKELKNKALEHSYFKERELYPNMDYFSGLLILSLGQLESDSAFEISEDFLTPFFALARVAGWISHIKAERGPIFRPQL